MNLFTYQDKKYKDFQSKLVVSKYPMIGIRLPVLRKLAKDISIEYFSCPLFFQYYEELILYGIVICKISNPINRLKKILEYIEYIDCWSICDYFCASASFVKKDKKYYFPFLCNLLYSEKEFHIRFSLVMFLKYYRDEETVDKILDEILKINVNAYYEKMALAWMLCEYYYLYPRKISSVIDKFDKEVIKMFNSKVKDSKKKL